MKILGHVIMIQHPKNWEKFCAENLLTRWCYNLTTAIREMLKFGHNMNANWGLMHIKFGGDRLRDRDFWRRKLTKSVQI